MLYKYQPTGAILWFVIITILSISGQLAACTRRHPHQRARKPGVPIAIDLEPLARWYGC